MSLSGADRMRIHRMSRINLGFEEDYYDPPSFSWLAVFIVAFMLAFGGYRLTTLEPVQSTEPNMSQVPEDRLMSIEPSWPTDDTQQVSQEAGVPNADDIFKDTFANTFE